MKTSKEEWEGGGGDKIGRMMVVTMAGSKSGVWAMHKHKGPRGSWNERNREGK